MNSGFTPEKVDKLADLLLIGLNDEERQIVFDEFEIIDKNINKINNIENISSIEPMTHALDNFEFELREDEVEESIPIDDLLANCDDTDDGCVSVPKVVG